MRFVDAGMLLNTNDTMIRHRLARKGYGCDFIERQRTMPTIHEAALSEAQQIVEKFPVKRSSVIPLLHLAQRCYGYVSPDAMREVAELSGLTPAQVQGVATFYTMFPLKPRGTYHVEICRNISCDITGAKDIGKRAIEKLGIGWGQTSADGRFTLDKVECIGNCSQGPCMQINGKEYGHLTPDEFDAVIDALE